MAALQRSAHAMPAAALPPRTYTDLRRSVERTLLDGQREVERSREFHRQAQPKNSPFGDTKGTR